MRAHLLSSFGNQFQKIDPRQRTVPTRDFQKSRISVTLKAMIPLSPECRQTPSPRHTRKMCRLALAAWLVIAALCILRFFFLKADFPNYSPWQVDQAKFADEGWWANAAVMNHLLGHWNVAGDYNPAAALPVWSILLSAIFHFTGVSLAAARAVNVALSIATLAIVFLLVRRYANNRSISSATLAVLLLAASPFAFAFSRLAILETLVIFEFCLGMLLASFATVRRIWPLAALSLLIGVMILTKTTAAMLLPAIFWLVWNTMGRKPAALLRAALTVVVIPFALVKAHAAFVTALGYGVDYHYFFAMNDMPDIDWKQAGSTLAALLQNCLWIDRILYPLALLILPLSLTCMRKLWSNPLFTAAWLAFAAQASFIFSRQDDYAPRYFLVMLIPLVLIAVLAFDEVAPHSKKAAAALLLAFAVSLAADAAMIVHFLTHRQYEFQNAASSIRQIVTGDHARNPLILGISGSQISLMTGIPSINDGYSSQDRAQKIALYRPGWYLVWQTIAPENSTLLSPFQLEKVASYTVFDNEDRNKLILYKMAPRAPSNAAIEQH
ncbi:MAG: glycosyltransferase family 39 protein [Terracidiphilus sp.]